MKKIVIFVLSASLIGGIIGIYYYTNVKYTFNIKEVFLFQTGVYSNYDKAMIASGDNKKIYFDGNLYHVYDSIVNTDNSKEKMVEYYNQNNIEYFIKAQLVNEDIFNELYKYSKLIEVSDTQTLKVINKQIIEKFGQKII